MFTSNNIENHARYRVGLILALVGLLCGITLLLEPARLVSAQTIAPSWSYTGNLNTFHYGHTATLLPNGKVLVAGDLSGAPGADHTAELYDPVTGTWSITGNLNRGRGLHTATLLLNGKVLVTDGFAVDTAELYDPATGTWSNTSSPKRDRVGHTATLLPNGKVLIAGGYSNGNLNSAELYDPTTGIWSFTGNLNIARSGHTATLLQNGKVLVAGGDSAEVYDPATGRWSITGSLNAYRLNADTATLLPNGKVLVAGGAVYDGSRGEDFTPLNNTELYDPSTETWTITGNLNEARFGHSATLLPNGRVLLAGGNLNGISAELYDPATGTWSITATLNTTRIYQTATLLPNGKVLIAGGGDFAALNTAELYDPGTGSTPNQIDDAQFFVPQHYLDFLNREPDPSGLAFWTNEITVCGTDPGCIEAKRINVSGAFFVSIEFQETGYLVYRIYKSSYGNLAGAPVPITLSEFLPDTRKIGQGVIVNQAGWETALENNKQVYMAEFVQRSRFTSAYPTSLTPDQFVDQLFMTADMTPSATDRTAAINEFGSATTTADVAARARALRRVAENSTFAQQEFNRAFVLMQYFGYLRRNPNDPPEATLDFQGYNFWLNKLNQFNGNFIQAEMVKAFLVSTEYRQRFGQP